MKENQFTKPVQAGIEYLDATYDGWWHKVDLTTLNMCERRHSILEQVTGLYLYDTLEMVTWEPHRMRLHGFSNMVHRKECVLLTAEWSYRIKQLKDARRWTQGEPPTGSPEEE